MAEKEANPGALGLGGFALTTFLLNLINAGILGATDLGMVLPMGLFYGGLAQFIAGMWDMKRGDTFGGTAFSSYGAFWMGLATMIILNFNVSVVGMAAFLLVWGFFTFYMFIASLKLARVVQVVFFTLALLFVLLAIGEFNPTVKMIGGWEGLFCAACAWYGSFGIVMNSVAGKEVVPLGHSKKR